jgi:hypothetical protein
MSLSFDRYQFNCWKKFCVVTLGPVGCAELAQRIMSVDATREKVRLVPQRILRASSDSFLKYIVLL